MCLMFALLDCLFSKEIHTNYNRIKSVTVGWMFLNKSPTMMCLAIKKKKKKKCNCKHHIKGKKKKSLQNLQNSVVQMGHLHTCPLNLKLMPTTSLNSLSHILHNGQTKDNTFEYIFHSQLKKQIPKLFRLFDQKVFLLGWDLSCLLMHHY